MRSGAPSALRSQRRKIKRQRVAGDYFEPARPALRDIGQSSEAARVALEPR